MIHKIQVNFTKLAMQKFVQRMFRNEILTILKQVLWSFISAHCFLFVFDFLFYFVFSNAIENKDPGDLKYGIKRDLYSSR